MGKFDIYLSYSSAYPEKFEDFLSQASKQGFAGVELIPDLTPNLPDEFNSSRLNGLIELLHRYKLKCTVHNFYMDINPTSLVPKVRELAFQLTQDVLCFASAIGANAVIVHTGYRFVPWRKRPEQAAMFEVVQKQVYTDLAILASEREIPVFLENGNYFITTRNGVKDPLHIGIEAEELMVIARIPYQRSFGICFDVSKAYLSAKDGGSVESILDYLKVVTPLLKEIHLNVFDNYHLVIPKVLLYLSNISFEGPIVLECSAQNVSKLLRLFDK